MPALVDQSCRQSPVCIVVVSMKERKMFWSNINNAIITMIFRMSLGLGFFKMSSFCVSEKMTPVESAALQCGPGQIVPTAKRTRPHEAQTTFECGLNDPISNAS